MATKTKPEPAVIHVRTSERRYFKRCPQRWKWAYPGGLTTRDPSHALWFGSGIHEALAHYYKPGTKRAKDFIEVWENWCDNGSGDGIYMPAQEYGSEYIEARELGIEMLRGHALFWDFDKDWDVIQPEMPFQVRIPLDNGTIIQYDGTFDGVYRSRSTKKIRLMEHKTAKSISFKHLSLDDQAGAYWAVAYTILRNRDILKAKQQIEGIQYNFLRKAMPDLRPVDSEGYRTNKPKKAHYVEALTDIDGWTPTELGKKKLDELESIAAANQLVILGERSATQPSPLFERHFVKRTPRERKQQIQKIKDEALWIQAAREGTLPIIKNSTMDCSWDCAFFEMCELHDARMDWEEFRDALFVVKDPYADHRKAA